MAEGAAAALRADVEVVANRAEGAASRRLVLRVKDWPGFGAGQFAMISPGPRAAALRSDPLLPRPMAIYRAQQSNGWADVEILLKVVGRGTALLAEAAPGQRIGFVGPLGSCFPDPEPGERALLVGGGTGIASLYQLALRSMRKTRVSVLLGAGTRDDLMGREDFAALDVELAIATEDGSEGERGLVTSLLETALQGPEAARVYVCGPTAMMRRVAEMAAARGCSCIASLENAMACGFGACLGCAVPLREGGFALVCSDGPAFDAARIDWEGLA